MRVGIGAGGTAKAPQTSVMSAKSIPRGLFLANVFAKCEMEFERENQLPPSEDKGSAVAGSTN
jgi:hypothetical protein